MNPLTTALSTQLPAQLARASATPSSPADKIPSTVQGQVRDILTHLRREVQVERTLQLIHLHMNNRLWKGEHGTIPNIVDGALRFSPLYELPGQTNATQIPTHRLNYYRGDGTKLIGALSIPPNMKAEIDDADNQDHQARKRIAQELITRLHRQWKLPWLPQDIVQAMYERGVVFIHTPFIVNGNRFGMQQVPNMIQGEMVLEPASYKCPNCGNANPVEAVEQTNFTCIQCQYSLDQSDYTPAVTVTGPVLDPANPYTSYPRGSVDCRLYDSRTTFTSFDLDKWDNAKWLCHEEELYRGELMAAYPWLRSEEQLVKFQGGGQDDFDDMYAKLVNKRSKAYTSNNNLAANEDKRLRWKHTCWYLTPEMFYQFDDAKVREQLLTQYPTGAKFILINNLLGDIQPSELHREWVAASPYAGGSFYQKPLGEEHATAAPLINTMLAVTVSTAQKGSPLVIYDSDLFDIEHLRNKPIMVQEFIKANPAVGKSLRDMLFQTSPAQLSPHVREVIELMIAGMRENDNISPHMYGAGPPEQTLGATSLKRDQAMQPHNVTYANIRLLLGRAMDNGVYQLVKHATPDQEVFFSPRPGEQEVYRHPDLQSLRLGGWFTYVDERIPMNWGQKEAKGWQMVTDVPPQIGAVLLGLDKPSNVKQFQEMLGFKDLKAANYDSYNKAMRMIALLSKQAPVEQFDPMTGQPMLLPSIPVDEFEDDHLFMATVVKDWAQSEAALELRFDQTKGNPAGYANVIAWGKQHLQIANMMMQPQVGPDGQPLPMDGGGGPGVGGGMGVGPTGPGGQLTPQPPGMPMGQPLPGAGTPPVRPEAVPEEIRGGRM